MTASNEPLDQEVKTDQDTHRNKREIRNRSPQAMRNTNKTLAVPTRSKRLARNPRICHSDVLRRRILYHIRVNDLVEGEWLTVLTSCHLDEWEANTNKQIDDDGATLFRARNPHSLDSGNFVEASVDAKRASRNRNVEASLKAGDCGMVIQ